MTAILIPVALLIASLAWGGLLFQKEMNLRAEAAQLQATTADLQKVRARNAELRLMQSLPQEIERLKRENAQLPAAQQELQQVRQRKTELEKQLVESRAALQRQHLQGLQEEIRQLSDGLEQP